METQDGLPWQLKVLILLSLLVVLFVVAIDVLHFAQSL
jgi:uncharacterized membrane protein